MVNGCDSIIAHHISTITTNVDLVQRNDSFKIFPNPNKSSTVHVEFSTAFNQGEVLVRDIHGIIRLRKQYVGQSNLELNISDFSKGIYLVEFQTLKERIIQKLIIQ